MLRQSRQPAEGRDLNGHGSPVAHLNAVALSQHHFGSDSDGLSNTLMRALRI